MKTESERRLEADRLVKADVVGNAYSDYDLWQDLYAYVSDLENPLECRAACIRKMDELTGVPESKGKGDYTLVKEYESQARQWGNWPHIDPRES